MSYWKASYSRPVSRGSAATVSVAEVLADKPPECAPTLVGGPGNITRARAVQYRLTGAGSASLWICAGFCPGSRQICRKPG